MKASTHIEQINIQSELKLNQSRSHLGIKEHPF